MTKQYGLTDSPSGMYCGSKGKQSVPCFLSCDEYLRKITELMRMTKVASIKCRLQPLDYLNTRVDHFKWINDY